MILQPKQKIIVVTGVESTGKSTLAKALSAEMEQAFVPEYARTYLDKRHGNYDYDDLEEIARLQLMAIQHATSEYVIVDTALIVLKIWSEAKYRKCAHYILNELANFKPAAYLLCNIDLPWEYDAQRVYPLLADRERVHQNFIAHLQEQASPFKIISGSEKERLERANTFINEF